MNFFRFRLNFSQKYKKFLRIGLNQAILDKKTREQMQLLTKNTPGLVARLSALKNQGNIRSDINIESLSVLVFGIAFSMSMFSDVMLKMDHSEVEAILSLTTKVLAKGLEPSREAFK